MKEYDKMLAGEYHFPYKDGVVDQRMMELQEKARIDLKNTMPLQTQTMKKNWLA